MTGIPWKAVFAFVVTIAASLLAFLQGQPGDSSLGDISGMQWVIAILSAVVLAGGVYVLPKE